MKWVRRDVLMWAVGKEAMQCQPPKGVINLIEELERGQITPIRAIRDMGYYRPIDTPGNKWLVEAFDRLRYSYVPLAIEVLQDGDKIVEPGHRVRRRIPEGFRLNDIDFEPPPPPEDYEEDEDEEDYEEGEPPEWLR